MARLPRLYAPDIPQLVQAEFAQPLAAASDPTPVQQLDQLMAWLRTDAREYRVALHAWLILNDRITLLATPPDERGISRLMQALGRRMAAGMRHGRVYKGRYRGALVQPGMWVLPAQIWLESLPVQGRYVDEPAHWPWSSAAGHAGIASSHADLATDHADYWHIGNTPFARQASYQALIGRGLTQPQGRRIQDALFGQWVLGDADFLEWIKTRASRRVAPAPRGRPRKAAAEPDTPARTLA
ncbi:hypothetical protein ERD78_14075 [Allopusillimonas soli]|uniref:Transposase n=1 Tax=Allopusillimonas soli TaxID=659016 RepID=A0A853FB74_9BURK|nr:hypothetical protein [Allopusillimonas soli]NYT38005.1 hypothetical protein [Allopusillimonas soli]TEA73899.1 hypothetical protein ERD78_14075 [Allopusillimonas soli]